jgi:hypothetical protein
MELIKVSRSSIIRTVLRYGFFLPYSIGFRWIGGSVFACFTAKSYEEGVALIW